jgi:hypothetical protein
MVTSCFPSLFEDKPKENGLNQSNDKFRLLREIVESFSKSLKIIQLFNVPKVA